MPVKIIFISREETYYRFIMAFIYTNNTIFLMSNLKLKLIDTIVIEKTTFAEPGRRIKCKYICRQIQINRYLEHRKEDNCTVWHRYKIDRQIEIKIFMQIDKNIGIQIDRYMYIQIDIQIDRYIELQIDIDNYRWIDRQIP